MRLNVSDYIGKRYGRLTILSYESMDKNHHRKFKCLCDCGKLKVTSIFSLKNGDTQSCGCIQKEKAAARFMKHGLSKTPTWVSWMEMKRRCINKKRNRASRYFLRGITFCERWLDFENFLEDMGERPMGYSLDRIDNDKDYYKENCKWSLPKEQARNRSTNTIITYKGESKCLSAWAEEYNIEQSVLRGRLYKSRWDMEKALTTKIRYSI